MNCEPAEKLGHLGLDALCELVNIGTGQALTALSQLAGGVKLTMSVPSAVTAATADVERCGSGTRGPALAVELAVGGALPCTFTLVFPQNAARSWAARLLGGPAQSEVISELEESALCELGNIACCAFLDATARLVRVRLLPGPPVLHADESAALLARACGQGRAPLAIMARLDSEAEPLSGWLVIAYEGQGTRWLRHLGLAATA